MPRFPKRLLRTWPRSVGPAFWAALSLQLGLAVCLAFVPLFDLLGYEYCAALALLVSATAGPVAIGLLRRRPDGSLTRAWIGALLANLACLALPLFISLLNALRVPNCNIGSGLLFFLLLPVAGAAVAGGWGLALGRLISRRYLAGLAYAGLWIGLASWSLWEAWRGPQIDSYNQLVGWLAGPIYDEVVEPGWALALCRVQGLSASLGLLGLVATVLPAAGVATLRARLRAAALGLLAGGLGLGLWGWSPQLGFGRSRAAIEQELSGVTRSDHFLIRHAANLDQGQATLLARDHEFRLHQIQRLLGDQPLPIIRAWAFPNAGRKRQLVGAGRTQYARPWDFELVLNGSGFPHPTLKHELVHVVAGSFGAWPFGVSARHAIWINPGLIEGIAVAVDWPVNRFDPHTWSAALRRIGKAPPIEQLFGPVGFWSAAAGRSYTLAGSFVRYLLTRYGPGPLTAAYRDGRLEGHYPQPTAALISDWQAHLDGLELDPGTLEVAKLRFASPSVFERVCAHEVAGLRARAGRALQRGDPAEAEALVERILGHLPDDQQALEFLIEVRLEQQRTADAVAIAEQLLAREDLGQASKAHLAGRMGDLMVRLERPARARELQTRLLDAQLGDASDRTALIKLQALERGPAGRRVLAFLERGKIDALALLDLHEVALADPGWAAAWYLLGRQLHNLGQPARAVEHLQRAARAGLEHPSLIAENLRLLAISLYLTAANPEADQAAGLAEKRRARSLAVLAVMAQFPRHAGEALELADWIERIHFDRSVALSIRVEPGTGID